MNAIMKVCNISTCFINMSIVTYITCIMTYLKCVSVYMDRLQYEVMQKQVFHDSCKV